MTIEKSQVLNNDEFNFMNIFWEKGSCTVSEVMNEFPSDNSLEYNTVLASINILVEKGFVKAEKRGRAIEYHPSIERVDATKRVIDYVVNRFFNDSPGQMAIDVISNEKISASDLEKLKILLDGKK